MTSNEKAQNTAILRIQRLIFILGDTFKTHFHVLLLKCAILIVFILYYERAKLT